MINPAQPPEGILDPQTPWWPLEQIGRHVWLRLKGQLTGRKIPELSNDQFASYVKLSDADADRLIENIKKYGKYPQLNKTDKSGGAYNEEPYQKWLVEEFLEKPFREQVDEKIEEKQIESRLKEIQETKKEIKEAETKEEVVAVIDDKVEVLEEIKEHIAPPRSDYQIPDPWEGSYTTPKSKAPQATVKKTKKRGRPIGTLKKSRKKKASAGGGPTPPNSPPPKKSFASKFGGGLKKTGSAIGKGIINFMEKGSSVGENEGPSVLAAGAWIGKKIGKAFQDAKKEKERAIDAENNGAEIPPEVKEKGYFLKKSLAYQFGGETLNKTVGAFFENIPSKQSSQKAGFGDKFDYGDADPKKKKEQNDIKDLASGFRNVKNALKGINKSIDQQVGLLTQLIGESSRVADTLEAIQIIIGQQIDVEIESDSGEQQQSVPSDVGGDINIGDINLGKGGPDALDILGGADDALDIAKLMRGKKKGLGRQNPMYRRMRRRGGPQLKGGMPKGKFGMMKGLLGAGRAMLSEGGTGTASVPAMIGEAGPELLIRNTPKKLAEGGVMQGTGSNIIATGLGASKGLMKRVQPFANVMQLPMKVAGAQISGALRALVAAAGPFSGAIAKMFSPLLGGLATIFGLNSSAAAAELDSAAMTEKEGAKTLSKFFANFFKLFGIDIGGGKEENTDKNIDPGDFTGNATEKGAKIAKMLMKDLGYADYQAAAIVGNLSQENTNLIPDLLEGSKKGLLRTAMDKGIGYGWAQWTDSGRQKQLYDIAKSKGVDPDKQPLTDAINYEMLKTEFPTYDSGGRFKSSKTIEEASNWVLTQYERPADQGPREQAERIADSKAVLAKISASKGVSQSITSSFSNQMQGIFEMDGPDTGYKVPEDLTGGMPVVGHGLEWLVKMSNKFIILPGVNKEYNVYEDPAKAFTRYEQIGQQGGVEVAGLVDAMDRLIFGSQKTGRTPVYGEGFKPKRIYSAADEDGAEVLRLLGGTRIKGASLPEGTVTPVSIPKDTVTGTKGDVAMVSVVTPVVIEVPVPVPVPGPVQYVPTNQYVAAATLAQLESAWRNS